MPQARSQSESCTSAAHVRDPLGRQRREAHLDRVGTCPRGHPRPNRVVAPGRVLLRVAADDVDGALDVGRAELREDDGAQRLGLALLQPEVQLVSVPVRVGGLHVRLTPGAPR